MSKQQFSYVRMNFLLLFTELTQGLISYQYILGT